MTTVVGTLIGVLLGFLGNWYLGYLTGRRARQLARDTGALDKPEYELSFFGIDTTDDSGRPRLFIFLHPGGHDDPAVFPFAFTIVNTGSTPCESAILSVWGPNETFLEEKGKKKSKIVVHPGVLQASANRVVVRQKHLAELSYSLPTMPPKTAFKVEDRFALPWTAKRPIQIPVETADGVKGTVHATFSAVLHYTVTLITPKKAVNATVQVATVPAKDLDEAVKLVESDPKQYIGQIPPGRTVHLTFMAFGVEESAERRGTTMYMMDADGGPSCRHVRITSQLMPHFVPFREAEKLREKLTEKRQKGR